MGSKDANQQEGAVVPDRSAERAVDDWQIQNPKKDDAKQARKLLASYRVDLAGGPNSEVVRTVRQDPEQKIIVLGALDYLAQDPEKENIAVLPITLTAVGLVIGVAVDFFTEDQDMLWLIALIAVAFVILALSGLLFSETRNRKTTRVAARAKSWATAIKEFRSDTAPHENDS